MENILEKALELSFVLLIEFLILIVILLFDKDFRILFFKMLGIYKTINQHLINTSSDELKFFKKALESPHWLYRHSTNYIIVRGSCILTLYDHDHNDSFCPDRLKNRLESVYTFELHGYTEIDNIEFVKFCAKKGFDNYSILEEKLGVKLPNLETK